MAHEPSPAARLVDRDWFSADTPDEALRATCEPAIAGAFLTRNEAPLSVEDDDDAAKTIVVDHRTIDHDSYLRRLKLRESRRTGVPCTAVWLAGAVAYRCRTCQTGEQSSVCVSCFRSGNLHEGHDTVVYRSETGGACDCGDTEAWALAGCCAAHRPTTGGLVLKKKKETFPTSETRKTIAQDDSADTDDDDDDDDEDVSETDDDTEGVSSSDVSNVSNEKTSKTSSSSSLKDAQAATFGVVFERLLLALESVAHARGPTRPTPAGARFAEECRIAEALMRWVTREAEAGAPLRRAAARALGAEWSPATPPDGGTAPRRAFPNAAYGMTQRATDSSIDNTELCELCVHVTTDDIRAELRERRVSLKTRHFGNAAGEHGDWPARGAAGCGLLECLLRASCLFSLPDALMEQATTLLLTLLFVPRFKRTFGKALVRHYDAVARFPETLPWPGVALRSLEPGASPSALEFSEAAYVAASPGLGFSARTLNANSDPIGPEPSRALTAYASRRASTSRCLDRVTVQLFGAAPVSAAPATRDALLRATAATLERCVVGRNPMNDPSLTLIDDAGHAHGTALDETNETNALVYRSPLLAFDPADEAARHRLFARPCNDLRMLLSRRDVARRWLYGAKTQSSFFRSAIKTLAAMAGMHAYRHKKGEHVLRESRAWIEAVTAETFVCSTFRAGVACVGDGLAGDKRAPPGRASSRDENENASSKTRFEDVTALLDARDALLDACADWHAGFVRHELQNDETVTRLRSNEHLLLSDLHASPVSMHVPLHRLWAVAAHWAAAARASLSLGGENGEKENTRVTDTRVRFADAETCRRIRQQAVHPLRALAFAEQVVNRVWVRNGEEIRRAAGVYASRYAAGVGRDADFGFTQMALVAEGFAEEDEPIKPMTAKTNPYETLDETLDVVRFVLAVGSAGAVAPARENAAAFPFPLADDVGEVRDDDVRDDDVETSSVQLGSDTTDRVCQTTTNETISDDRPVRMAICADWTISDAVYPDPSSLPAGALACARATARLLVSLTRDRAWLTREPFEARCRREVVHQLAARGRRGVTFSALAELLPAAVAAEAADVERALARVAVKAATTGDSEEGSARLGASYALRDDVWFCAEGGFDAFFHRYSRGEHDAALAEATRLWVRSRRLERKQKAPYAGKNADDVVAEISPDGQTRGSGSGSGTFAWSPATLLRAPAAPPEPFARLARFTRHVSLATFARDALCFLRERPECADLQDLGISAMALVKAALEPESPSASRPDPSRTRDREAYLAALFRSPRGVFFPPNGTSRSGFRSGERLPRVVECLDALAERRPRPETGGAFFWREEDSHASVLVAECAALLARDLRDAGGLPERVDPSRSAETRAGSADATMTDAFAPTAEEGDGETLGVDAFGAPPPDARRERARLAKERQAAVLAAMAARQKAFADTLLEREDDDRSADEEMDDDAVRTAAERTDFVLKSDDAARADVDARADVADRSSAETVKDETVKPRTRTRTRRLAWDPVPECALCGDDTHENAGQLCWLARRQRAFAPSAGRALAKRREKKAKSKKSDCFQSVEEDASFRSVEHETHAAHDSSDDDDAFAASVDALECVGFLPVTCGHGAHAACLDRYVRSTHGRADGDEETANETAATDPNETRRMEREASTGLCGSEFRCPACRRICDVVVPALAATPSQLERELQTSNGPRSKRLVGPEIKDASSINAALVATVNGLVRPKPVKSVTNTANTANTDERPDERPDARLDERLDDAYTSFPTDKQSDAAAAAADFVSAVFSAPFAEPPLPGSVSVFGGSFVRSRGEDDASEGADAEDDARARVGTYAVKASERSFETHPETASRPRDWLKLAQIVATLDAQRGAFARHEDQSAKNAGGARGGVPGSAEAVSAGLWRAAREIARRAMLGSAGLGAARAAVPGVVARRSLAAALSRALGTAARKNASDSEASESREALEAREPFSVLAFGAQVEAQAVRRFEWDAVKRRRFTRSSLGFNRARRAGTRETPEETPAAPEPPPGPEAEDDGVFGVFSLVGGAFEDPEDPDSLVAETVDAVLADARAELVSSVSSRSHFSRSRVDISAEGVSDEDAEFRVPNPTPSTTNTLPTREENVKRVSSGTTRDTRRETESSSSLFRGGDSLFLKRAPFLFLVELLARADAFQPGVFGETGGVEKTEAFARAAFFAAARDAVDESVASLASSLRPSAFQSRFFRDAFFSSKDSLERQSSDSGLSRFTSVVARLASFSPRLERMAWRTETLLAILRGEPFDKAAFFGARDVSSVANLLTETDARRLVERVSSRLFRAPFEDVVVSALEDADDALKANAFTRVSAWRISRRENDVNDATPETTDASFSFSEKECGKEEDADDADAFLRDVFAHPAPFVPPAFEVSALPRLFEHLLARFAESTCERCLAKPRDPAVCLVCGAVMCCADASCAAPEPKPKRGRDVRDAARDERALRFFSRDAYRRDELEQREERDEIRRPFFLYDASSKTKTHGALGDAVVLEDAGACSEHASRRKCGGGSCCFLLLKSTRVLILHSSGTRACLFPSPYVDAHGEEDEHMRRGRPLFLDAARARLLETLWASGALEHDSRATGASRLGGEWY